MRQNVQIPALCFPCDANIGEGGHMLGKDSSLDPRPNFLNDHFLNDFFPQASNKDQTTRYTKRQTLLSDTAMQALQSFKQSLASKQDSLELWSALCGCAASSQTQMLARHY